MGLLLYAIGAFLFFPAKESGSFYPFLLAYFILTCGLSFLETSANPYILTMGPEETSTQRLNLAQSFNPMGSLAGMYVAMNYIQSRIHPMSTAERALLTDAEFVAMRQSDLSILITPYLAIGIVVLVMLVIIGITRMPTNGDKNKEINFFPTIKQFFRSQLPPGCDCSVLLCGCTDYVLDIYHCTAHVSSWRRYGRTGCRGIVAV